MLRLLILLAARALRSALSAGEKELASLSCLSVSADMPPSVAFWAKEAAEMARAQISV